MPGGGESPGVNAQAWRLATLQMQFGKRRAVASSPQGGGEPAVDAYWAIVLHFACAHMGPPHAHRGQMHWPTEETILLLTIEKTHVENHVRSPKPSPSRKALICVANRTNRQLPSTSYENHKFGPPSAELSRTSHCRRVQTA